MHAGGKHFKELAYLISFLVLQMLGAFFFKKTLLDFAEKKSVKIGSEYC